MKKREELSKDAKNNIVKIQQDNRKQLNLRRKKPGN